MDQEVLNKYHTNLNYDDINEILNKLYDVINTVKFESSQDILYRIMILADTIDKHISLFKIVCRHVDVIATISQYLHNFFTHICYDTEFRERLYIFMELLATLMSIFDEVVIKSYLHSIFINFPHDLPDIATYLTNWRAIIKLEIQVIILEDSDIHAVISYLKITDNSCLSKIWVQERVKEKFLWLMKRDYSDAFTIGTFQSLKEIQLDLCRMCTIYIVSIWSEDIIAAKNFALSLNSHIIFINAHMDFIDSCIIFPYQKISNQRMVKRNIVAICEDEAELIYIELSENVVHSSHLPEIDFISIYNLFYDGIWQEPIKGTYSKQNDNLWANAAKDDIIMCYLSAEKGYKIWSIKSIKTRIQILSKFISILKLKNKFVLAAIVERWLNIPYKLDIIEGFMNDRSDVIIETTEVRKPFGVIILREENENVLFIRLMQNLIVGNSVIVMCNENFFNLAPYFDMFSTCGIPPGVINLLSHEDINMLELKLCSEKYTQYVDNLYSKGNPKEIYSKSYKKLTVPTNIIIYY